MVTTGPVVTEIVPVPATSTPFDPGLAVVVGPVTTVIGSPAPRMIVPGLLLPPVVTEPVRSLIVHAPAPRIRQTAGSVVSETPGELLPAVEISARLIVMRPGELMSTPAELAPVVVTSPGVPVASLGIPVAGVSVTLHPPMPSTKQTWGLVAMSIALAPRPAVWMRPTLPVVGPAARTRMPVAPAP